MTSHSFTARFASELAARNQDGPDPGVLGDVFESAAEEAAETFSGSTESDTEPINTQVDFASPTSTSGSSLGGAGGFNLWMWVANNLDKVIIAGVALYVLMVLGPVFELLGGLTDG